MHLLYPSVAPELRLIRVQNHFVYPGVINPDLHEENWVLVQLGQEIKGLVRGHVHNDVC